VSVCVSVHSCTLFHFVEEFITTGSIGDARETIERMLSTNSDQRVY